MDILKVKLVIVGNVLNYKVEEQPDYLRKMDSFKAGNGIRLCACEHLQLCRDGYVYLRGTTKAKDNRITSLELDTPDQALAMAERIRKAFYEFERYMFNYPPSTEGEVINYTVLRNGCNVIFTIYDQIQLPTGYCFPSKDEEKYLTIRALDGPGIKLNNIFLRGKNKNMDDTISMLTLKTEKKAEQYANKVIDSINFWMLNFKLPNELKVQVNIEILPI